MGPLLFIKVFMFYLHQLDLEKPKRITGIITQGAKDFGVVQFVSAFKIAYSNDGQSWSIVKDATNRTDKVSECSPFFVASYTTATVEL